LFGVQANEASSSLAKQDQRRLPSAGTIIASSYTSPIDCLYLAAIFDPIFTASYPGTRGLHQVSLFQAMLRAFFPPPTAPPPKARLVDIATLLRENPDSSIAVFPECTTTNGRGIMPFSPSLLTAPPKAKIFPVSLRYTPADITTPIPGTFLSFLWNLCSKPTHCIRTRLAESVYNTSADVNNIQPVAGKKANSYETNFFDDFGDKQVATGDGSHSDGLTDEERRVLDNVAEALARLGRVKRVGLGVKEKQDFLSLWRKRHKTG